jgi:hypothetical protein
MRIVGVAVPYPFRAAGKNPMEQSSDSSTAGSDENTPLQRALDALKATDMAAAQGKARAQQKLEDAKQRIDYLRQWGFPPQVIAQQATEIAKEVGSAAHDFAAAMQAGVPSATPDAVTASIVEESPDPDSETTGEDGNLSLAQKTYGDVVKDGGKSASNAAGDERTVQEFSSVAQQLRQLLEEAARRMRAEKTAESEISTGMKAGDGLQAVIGGLENAFASAAQSAGFAASPATATAVISI